MNLLKKVLVPSGEKQELEAHETWVVRWRSRHGDYSGETQPEMELFTNESDAMKFANELKAAFKLIKHTSGTKVTVKRND